MSTYKITREVAPHNYTDYETFDGDENTVADRLRYLSLYIPGRYKAELIETVPSSDVAEKPKRKPRKKSTPTQ